MSDPAAAARAIAALKPLLGDRLVTSQAVREHHAKDMSYIPASMPDAVAFPQTEAEVQAIVKACAEHRVPVVAYGAGSSMEGHTIPRRGGISVDTREIYLIDPNDPAELAEAERLTDLLVEISDPSDPICRGTSATGAATMTGRDRRVTMMATVCCKSTHKR